MTYLKLHNEQSKILRSQVIVPFPFSSILFWNDLHSLTFVGHYSIKSFLCHIIAIDIPLRLYQGFHYITGSWTKAETHLIVFSTSIESLNARRRISKDKFSIQEQIVYQESTYSKMFLQTWHCFKDISSSSLVTVDVCYKFAKITTSFLTALSNHNHFLIKLQSCYHRKNLSIQNTLSCKAAVIASRASKRGIPANSEPPLLFIFPSSVRMLMNSRLWRLPTSKSFGSWAGVICKRMKQDLQTSTVQQK